MIIDNPSEQAPEQFPQEIIEGENIGKNIFAEEGNMKLATREILMFVVFCGVYIFTIFAQLDVTNICEVNTPILDELNGYTDAVNEITTPDGVWEWMVGIQESLFSQGGNRLALAQYNLVATPLRFTQRRIKMTDSRFGDFKNLNLQVWVDDGFGAGESSSSEDKSAFGPGTHGFRYETDSVYSQGGFVFKFKPEEAAGVGTPGTEGEGESARELAGEVESESESEVGDPTETTETAVPTPTPLEEEIAAFKEAQGQGWMDRQTRTITVDMTVYNPFYDYITVFTVVFEFQASGIVKSEPSLNNLRMGYYKTTLDYIRAGCEVIFVGFVIFYVVVEILEIVNDCDTAKADIEREKTKKVSQNKEEGRNKTCRVKCGEWLAIFSRGLKIHFQSAWNWLDFIYLICSLIGIIFWAMFIGNHYQKTLDLGKISDADMSNHFLSLSFILKQYARFSSFVMVIVFIRVLHYLAQWFERVSVLFNTLGKAKTESFYFFIMLFTIFFAFVISAYTYFGSQDNNFSAMGKVFIVLFKFILSNIDEMEGMLKTKYPWYGLLFFVIYMTTLQFILINMFIAFIASAYEEANTEHFEKQRENLKSTSIEVHPVHKMVVFFQKIIAKCHKGTQNKLADKRLKYANFINYSGLHTDENFDYNKTYEPQAELTAEKVQLPFLSEEQEEHQNLIRNKKCGKVFWSAVLFLSYCAILITVLLTQLRITPGFHITNSIYTAIEGVSFEAEGEETDEEAAESPGEGLRRFLSDPMNIIHSTPPEQWEDYDLLGIKQRFSARNPATRRRLDDDEEDDGSVNFLSLGSFEDIISWLNILPSLAAPKQVDPETGERDLQSTDLKLFINDVQYLVTGKFRISFKMSEVRKVDELLTSDVYKQKGDWKELTDPVYKDKYHYSDNGGYDGDSGYVLYVSAEESEFQKVVKNFQDDDIVSERLFSLIIDFITYEASTDFYVYTALKLNLPATGAFESKVEIFPLQLNKYKTQQDYGRAVGESIYIIFLIYYIVLYIRDIRSKNEEYNKWYTLEILSQFNHLQKYRREQVTPEWIRKMKFIFNMFKIMELMSFLFSFITIIFWIRYLMTTMSMDITLPFTGDIEEVFAEIYNATAYMRIYNNFCGINTIFLSIRVLEYMQRSKHMNLLTTTLNNAQEDISYYILVLACLLFGFVGMANLCFGYILPGYSSFGLSLLKCFQMIIGDFDYGELETADVYMAPLFFFPFNILFVFILLNIFLAILDNHYGRITAKANLEADDTNILHILFCCFIKERKGKAKEEKDGKDDGVNKDEELEIFDNIMVNMDAKTASVKLWATHCSEEIRAEFDIRTRMREKNFANAKRLTQIMANKNQEQAEKLEKAHILSERVKYWNYLRLGNQYFNYQCVALEKKLREVENEIGELNQKYEEEHGKTQQVYEYVGLLEQPLVYHLNRMREYQTEIANIDRPAREALKRAIYWTREDQIMWMGEKAKDILERTQEELYIEIWNTETASPTQLIGVMAYIYHKLVEEINSFIFKEVDVLFPQLFHSSSQIEAHSNMNEIMIFEESLPKQWLVTNFPNLGTNPFLKQIPLSAQDEYKDKKYFPEFVKYSLQIEDIEVHNQLFAFNNTALGGTFDHLHPGHKIFITTGLLLTKKHLTIGLTSSTILTHKKLHSALSHYSTRHKLLESFLRRIAKIKYTICELKDVAGPTGTDSYLEALFLTQETWKGGEIINGIRRDNHLPEVYLLRAPLIIPKGVEIANKLSSSGIREYIKDRVGGHMDEMKDMWTLLILDTFPMGDNRNVVEEWWDIIRDKYSERVRHYHTLTHIYHALTVLNTTSILNAVTDPHLIQFAIWFHDLVYEPTSSLNEQESANMFEEFCKSVEYTVDSPKYGILIKNVIEFILSTKTHEINDVGNKDDEYLIQNRTFIDIDMSILGSSPEVYLEYAHCIRKEYSFIPEEIYCSRRIDVLQSFLKKDHIYLTLEFQDLYESMAIININNEIDSLRQLLN